MGKLKVYISSTFLDLQVPRDMIIKRIQEGLSEQFELTHIMEHMSGDFENRSNIDICLAEVRKADVYILLTGNRYGSHPQEFKNREGVIQPNTECRSYTELEYDTACETLPKKFYGVYKLLLTDNFFSSEAIDMQSDLEIDDRKKRHASFLDKLEKADTLIQINNGNDLVKAINNKLSEFFMKYNKKVELNIGPADKVSIDRKEVLKEIDGIEKTGGAYTFLLEVENDDDGYKEFSTKLQDVLAKRAPTNDIFVIQSGSTHHLTTLDKKLVQILRESSINIYGDVQNGVNFDWLAKDLETKNITNVFINFLVDRQIDMLPEGSDFMQVIAAFIKKIDTLLTEKEFRYNFYFIIYTLLPKDQRLPTELKTFFNGIRFYQFGRLPDIRKIDAWDWLDEIRKKNSLTGEDTDTLFKLIFLEDERFPTKYKKCIQLIDNRTKLPNL